MGYRIDSFPNESPASLTFFIAANFFAVTRWKELNVMLSNKSLAPNN